MAVDALTRYVSLHTHSSHSPRDGLSQIADLAKAAADDGQPAIAITDHGTVSSAWKLAKAARAAGIKPIIGMEAYLAIGDRNREGFEIAPRDVLDADGGEAGTNKGFKKKTYEHLTLLAATAEGYQNLSMLASKSAESFWSKPRIDYDLLREHHRGIIVLTGCISGPIAGTLLLDGMDAAQEMIDGNPNIITRTEGDRTVIDGKAMTKRNLGKLISVFEGESADYIRDHLFIEVMEHDTSAEQKVTERLFSMAKWTRRLLADLDEADGTENLPLKVVATNDSHFTHADDHDAHDLWLCIGASSPRRTYRVTDTDRWTFTGTGYHMRTYDEMIAAFSRYGNAGIDAVHQSAAIADMVEPDVLPESRIRLPKFPVPAEFRDPVAPDNDNKASRNYIKHLIKIGAAERYGDDWPTGRPDVKDRLNHELKVIGRLGFIDYFLIVHDLVTWARSNGIRVGPGRGSAAGSMVSYCLGIVQIDPLQFDLLFERFLDDTREEMPDIDLDFEQAHQGEIFAHLKQRWGEDRVARLGTFGFSRARQSLKNAARSMLPADTSVKLGTKLANLIPGLSTTLADIANPGFASGELLREELAGDKQAREVFDAARTIEGVISNEGVHACGVIISTEPLAPMVPLRKDRRADRSDWVTQFDGKDVADMGLLKLDVLGLRNLDIITESVRQIRATDQSEFAQTFDPEKLPTDPNNPMVAKTWAMLAAGKTTGVFQLESSGMTTLTEAVRPESIEELSALVALYRPGPLSAGFHDLYARRKHGEEPIDYSIFTEDTDEQEVIASVLGDTYGVSIYQEQLMRLGTVVAGFGPAENNRLRRAVSKKKHDEMAAVGKLFVDGAQRQIVDADGTVQKISFAKDTAIKVWDSMKGAGDYLFNKSHSAAYGFVAYITAFLKANWPVQYGAATLSATDSDERRAAVLAALRADGVTVLPPSVCESGITSEAVLTDDDSRLVVRLGLGEIKGVGSDVASAIVSNRTTHGTYRSLANLMNRVVVDGANGQAPITNASTRALIEAGACDTFPVSGGGRVTFTRKGSLMAMGSLRTHLECEVPDDEFSSLRRSVKERSRLGVLLSISPLSRHSRQLKSWSYGDENNNGRPTQIHKITGEDGDAVFTLGIASGIEERMYGDGKRLMKLLLEGSKESIPVLAFDNMVRRLSRSGTMPKAGDIIAVHGRIKTSKARPRTNELETDGVEDMESVDEEETRKEITAFEIIPVEVDDDSVSETVIDAVGMGELVRLFGDGAPETGEHSTVTDHDPQGVSDTADAEQSGIPSVLDRTPAADSASGLSAESGGGTYDIFTVPIPEGRDVRKHLEFHLDKKWIRTLRLFINRDRNKLVDKNDTIPSRLSEGERTEPIIGDNPNLVMVLVGVAKGIERQPVVERVSGGAAALAKAA